jgi:hypothetical protein
LHSEQKTTAKAWEFALEDYAVARRYFETALEPEERARVEAEYELDAAASYFGAPHPDRRRGLRALLRALRLAPTLAARRRFPRVLGYALAPRALVGWLEARRLRWHLLGKER